MAEQQQITFPSTHYTVGDDGVLCEVFHSPTHSTRFVISEAEVNQILQVWVEKQKQLHLKQQLLADALGSQIESLTSGEASARTGNTTQEI